MIFVLSMGYVATERDVRKDVSYFKTTAPSGATVTMLGKLDQPIRVVLFFPPGSDVLAAVQPYFDALKASGKLSVEARDIALSPELAQKHKVRDNGVALLLQVRANRKRARLSSARAHDARRTIASSTAHSQDHPS